MTTLMDEDVPAPLAAQQNLDAVMDVGNLMVTNMAVDVSEITERQLMDHSAAAANKLMRQLFGLPVVPSDSGRVVALPRCTTKLPREKRLPEPKTPTKWERYAKSKGIVKLKKERRVYDEELKQYVPTYGRGKKMVDRAKNWAIEMADDYQPKTEGGDPFLDAEIARKERISKQKKAEQRNKNFASKIKKSTASISDTMDKLATASFGKFDK
eukprot:NODE_3798_length_914_cov_25.252023_g3492_i0.p1 GENE.NODE_3798_length_914_cov_25.252023_g3492_i0~~NODE_3798_length_914_cov_25.252023_g3492_i0.p1  ORF type:complete len:239 (+),score=68.52 NODE_3798_length_914_cov_25.252023_g3492_i0:83-718(+)